MAQDKGGGFSFDDPLQKSVADYEKEFGERVDKALKVWLTRHKTLNVGLLRDLCQAAITKGAPLYSQGNPAACFRIYRVVVTKITSLTERQDNTPVHLTNPAKALLNQLSMGLKQADDSKDPIRGAWILRNQFDSVLLEWQIFTQRQLFCLQKSAEMTKIHFYDQAAAYLKHVNSILTEIMILNPKKLDLKLKTYFFYLSRLHLAMGKFDEAGIALKKQAPFVPNWPIYQLNVAEIIGAKLYKQRIEELAAKYRGSQATMNEVYLLGHDLYFSSPDKKQALQLIAAVGRKDANHFGAKAFMQLLPESEMQKTIQSLIKQLSRLEASKVTEAEQKLRKYGGWAHLAIRREISKTSLDPIVRQRLEKLLRTAPNTPKPGGQ